MVRGMTEQATIAALFDELTSARLQRFPAKGVKLDAPPRSRPPLLPNALAFLAQLPRLVAGRVGTVAQPLDCVELSEIGLPLVPAHLAFAPAANGTTLIRLPAVPD